MSTPHSKAGYTPGPWKCDEYGVVVGGDSSGTSVAETYLYKYTVRAASVKDEAIRAVMARLADEAVVNGRLIELAPEMYELLKSLLERKLDPEQALEEIRRIIERVDCVRQECKDGNRKGEEV